jgi:hypothetical protein
MSAEALTLSHPLVWGMLVYSILALVLAWGLTHARLYEGLDQADTLWEQLQAVMGIMRVLMTSALLNHTLYRLIPPLRRITLVRLIIPRALAEGWKRLGRP